MNEQLKRCQKWEAYLMNRCWFAPITLEQAREELDEAIEATTDDEIESELGDVLQVIFRYAERRGIDLERAVERSLDRNIKRTLFVIDKAQRSVMTEERMTALWCEAKKVLG